MPPQPDTSTDAPPKPDLPSRRRRPNEPRPETTPSVQRVTPDARPIAPPLPETAQERAAPAASLPGEVDRVGLLWRAKWVVVLVALVAGGAVYAISTQMPATYESSAVLRVAAQRDQSGPSTAATASNDLASQYAQLVTSSSTLDGAARALGTNRASLNGKVAGETVAAQNLIRVTSQGDEPAQSAARANAVARSLDGYIRRLGTRQADRYGRALAERLRPLNTSIRSARAALANSSKSDRGEAASLLSSLLVQRSQLQSSSATSQAGSQPAVDLVSRADPGGQIAPKPQLYAIVAFIVALLLAAQLSVAVLSRRTTG